MCAQGFSAGSAAVAYSLAYYGLGSNLDNVELISGPVLSDIKQGCQEPPPAQINICGTVGGSEQYGCGSQTSWMLSPTYVPNGANYLSSWTNDTTCTASGGTSGASNSRWLAQSIVDQSNITGLGATPTFNYLSTGMAAWLCRSVQHQQTDCTGSNYNYDYCPNNSSSQGNIFYLNITASNTPPVYNIYAVDGCFGPEGAPQGNVPALQGNPGGQAAIENHMSEQCTHRTQ